MSIDKQRIAAVRILQALGYTWECSRWKPPPGDGPAPLGERDLELLRGTICRWLYATPEAIAPLIAEIKGWGWFR